MWHVYIIQCKDGKLYTGITTNIERRLEEHSIGHGGRFTRVRKPVTLVYSEEIQNRSEALKREANIKKLTRSEKIAFIKTNSCAEMVELADTHG